MSFDVGPRTISANGGSIKRVGNYRIHTFPSELFTDGLVLNLDAGDPRSYPGSGTSWTDLSGNGNTGTLTNGPTYNNANGGSIVFDGTNDFINIPHNSSLTSTSALTINCWVKSQSLSAYNAIIGKGTSDANEEYTVAFTSDRIYFDIGNGAGPYVSALYNFSNNVWYNICCIHSRTAGISNLLCYVNGVIVSGSTILGTNTPNNNSFPISIGSRSYDTPTLPFYGNISNVSIYNRALSAAEVAQNYDALKVRYTSYTNTFTPLCGGGSGKVEVLCVAGGGGGGGYAGGAGGGAGGLLYNSAFTVSSNTGIALTVGAGGTGG